MISSREYIALARELAQGATDAHTRRAVSTAYYAAFHAVTRALVSSLVPETKEALFAQVYRKPDHKQFYDGALLRGPGGPEAIRTTMKNLCEWRERADYDVSAFDPPIGQIIDSAEEVIGLVEKLDRDALLQLAVNVLIVKPKR